MRTRFQYFGVQNNETTCDNFEVAVRSIYSGIWLSILAPICYAVDILKTFFSCSDVKWWNFNVKVDAPCFSLSLIHFK